MIRKWEWVREYCKWHGFDKSAEVADEIDRVLCYLYGEVNTGEWEGYVRAATSGISEVGGTDLSVANVLGTIIMSSDFCIACKESVCPDCEFGKLTGLCGDSDSLYLEVIRCFWQDSGALFV